MATRPVPLGRQPETPGGPLWTCDVQRCYGDFPKASSPSSRNFPVPIPEARPLEEVRTNFRETVALVVEANRVMARRVASGGLPSDRRSLSLGKAPGLAGAQTPRPPAG